MGEDVSAEEERSIVLRGAWKSSHQNEDIPADDIEKHAIILNRTMTAEEIRADYDLLARQGYPKVLNRAHPLAKGLVGMWVSCPDGSWRDLTRPRPADDAPDDATVPLDALVKPETWHDRPGML